MGVTFVIGRAGSGKTRRCLDRLAQACTEQPLGRPIFWLVPRQATFQAERELVVRLGAFSRARVVSFNMLGRLIAEDCGESAVPDVSDLGRRMILGHLLRQNQPRLRFFASVAHRPGLAGELDATFAELERTGKTVDDLRRLIDELRAGDPDDAQGPSFQAKLHDLALLYEAYGTYLGQERLDQHRRLMQILQKIQNCKLLKGAAVYVDAFIDFTDYERQVLAGLGKTCASVEISLMIDPLSPVLRDPHRMPDELSLFFRTEEAFRKLWFTFSREQVPLTDPIALATTQRYRSQVLRDIERDLFSKANPPSLGVPANASEIPLKLIEAPDRAAEVDAAAREIRSLLREGLRLREIVVLARDLAPYHGLIDRSFQEHDIPYFVDRRRNAAHHPLLRFFRAALQIAQGRWSHPVVMSLLKSGLAGVSFDEADEIESYLLEQRLRDRPWDNAAAWPLRRATMPAPDPFLPEEEAFNNRSVESLRRQIVERLSPLLQCFAGGKSVAIREVAGRVFDVFERFHVRKTMSAWANAAAAKDLEQAAEHEQVWREFVDLFDQVVDLLGEEPVTAAGFVDVLETGLEQFDLALTPPTVDQVLVGAVDRTRTPAVRAAIVLGLSEGQFPRIARDGSILSHNERRELRRLKLDLGPDLHRRQFDEPLLAYLAFTRASQKLIVTRSLSADRDTAAEPSPYWHELRRLAPDAPVSMISRDRARDVGNIATPRQLMATLMAWAREVGSEGEIGRGGNADSGTGEYAQIPADSASPSVSLSTNPLVPPPACPSSPPLPLSPSPPPSDPRSALYHWLVTDSTRHPVLDAVRRVAWPALSYRNDPVLSPAVAAAMFTSPLRADARQIETFAACPHQHFLKYGMRLTDRAAPRMSAMDTSRIYHQMLTILVADVLKEDRDWQELTPPKAREIIESLARPVAQQLRGEMMLDDARSEYLLGRIERMVEQIVASMRAMLARGKFRPAYADVTFGDRSKLPPYRVKTPRGAEVHIRGKIDRIDRIPDDSSRGAVAVYDYRLGGGALSISQLLHGLSLQLLTYLLVLESNGQPLLGATITPAAAFLFPLIRSTQVVEHPDDAVGPDDPNFYLRERPRGVIDSRFFEAFDNQPQVGKPSEVVKAYIRKDGEFGKRDSSDIADPHELAVMLGHVRQRIGLMADRIMSGGIEVHPYRMGRESPCANCDFRAVCRFDPTQMRYRTLRAYSRDDALAQMNTGGRRAE